MFQVVFVTWFSFTAIRKDNTKKTRSEVFFMKNILIEESGYKT